MRIELEKYRILTTGVDGGHSYLITEIAYQRGLGNGSVILWAEILSFK